MLALITEITRVLVIAIRNFHAFSLFYDFRYSLCFFPLFFSYCSLRCLIIFPFSFFKYFTTVFRRETWNSIINEMILNFNETRAISCDSLKRPAYNLIIFSTYKNLLYLLVRNDKLLIHRLIVYPPLSSVFSPYVNFYLKLISALLFVGTCMLFL